MARGAGRAGAWRVSGSPVTSTMTTHSQPREGLVDQSVLPMPHRAVSRAVRTPPGGKASGRVERAGPLQSRSRLLPSHQFIAEETDPHHQRGHAEAIQDTRSCSLSRGQQGGQWAWRGASPPSHPPQTVQGWHCRMLSVHRFIPGLCARRALQEFPQSRSALGISWLPHPSPPSDVS